MAIIPEEKIKNILIINLGGVGDLLLSTPALRSLRKLYPRARLVLLTVPRSAQIMEDFPYLDELITFDFRNEESREMRTLLGIPQLIKVCLFLISLRGRKFDMLINMRTLASFGGALKMAFIFYIIGAKYRVGRNTDGRGFFLSLKIPEKLFGKMHEGDYDLQLVKLLGGEIDERKLELKINEEDNIYINDFFKKNSISPEDILIAVNPGAPWPSKRWPVENFAQVIERLSEKLKCIIIITGDSKEMEIAQRLNKLTRARTIISTGKTNIKQFAALVKRCNLFITNDTGAMHVAAAMNTPMVAIFGPGYLDRYRPYGNPDRFFVLHKKVDCAPCDLIRCNSLKCFKLILVEEVLNAAYTVLQRSQGKEIM